MYKFRNPYYVYPPGSIWQNLEHPYLPNENIELAIFQEHRYAFFFWAKWSRNTERSNAPCLVTFDWHQDLCYPCATEKKWLKNLNVNSDGAVALFSWAKLAGNNDGHILSAAYLNLIGNIYVYCRSANFDNDWRDESIIDIFGNLHIIKKFKTKEAITEYLQSTKEKEAYFDIDLDFFTYNNPYNQRGKKYTYMSKRDMENILSVDNMLIKWIFTRLKGFTIATEPLHCGGLNKSMKLLNILIDIYFTPDVYIDTSLWKHKLKS